MNIGNQGYLFIIFTVMGTIIGILFDIFRILRKAFQTPDFITYLQDFLFWILAGTVFIYTILTFHNGEIRLYIFIGLLLGLLLHFTFISKVFIRISVTFLLFLKKITCKTMDIIIFPLKIFLKILKKPISFIFINLRKSGKNFLITLSKSFKKLKISIKRVKNTTN